MWYVLLTCFLGQESPHFNVQNPIPICAKICNPTSASWIIGKMIESLIKSLNLLYDGSVVTAYNITLIFFFLSNFHGNQTIHGQHNLGFN